MTKRVIAITYDSRSNSHVLTRNILKQAFQAAGLACPSFVSTSMAKLKNRFLSKRSILGKIKTHIQSN